MKGMGRKETLGADDAELIRRNTRMLMARHEVGTVEDLAQLAGVRAGTLRGKLAGRISLDLKDSALLGQVFGVRTKDLLAEAEEEVAALLAKASRPRRRERRDPRADRTLRRSAA